METDNLVLTEEEMRQVEEGEAAGLLLDSPVFLLAIERVRQDASEGILTSPPEAKAAREDLYNLSRGLSAVTAQLADMAALGQSIAENAALLSPQDDDEVQADDDQPDLFGSY